MDFFDEPIFFIQVSFWERYSTTALISYEIYLQAVIYMMCSLI